MENNDVLEVGASKKEDGDRTITVFNDHKETIGCSQAKSGSRTLTVMTSNLLQPTKTQPGSSPPCAPRARTW